jgi:hypothetical protein
LCVRADTFLWPPGHGSVSARSELNLTHVAQLSQKMLAEAFHQTDLRLPNGFARGPEPVADLLK